MFLVADVQAAAWLQVGQISTSADAFVTAVMERDGAPERLADMAAKLHETLSKQEAAAVAALARTLAPDDPWIAAKTADLIKPVIPRWHWAIARDTRRNEAYDQALRANITGDSIVLEVGTGSGILAMMAARAGARHVYTIEIVPLIAEAARENIARNGFADSITVICADALKISVGKELPKRCNVFLHEIVSNDLLGEYVLPITAYARETLLTEDALHLPDHIWMTCQVGHIERSDRLAPLGQQAGFDLSAMDLLHAPDVLKHGPLTNFTPGTDAVEVMRFDLTGKVADPAPDVTRDVTVSHSGVVNVIAQWIGFSFPGGTEFTNPPDTYSSWALRMWPTAERILTQGEMLKLRRRFEGVRAMPMIGPDSATD